MIGVVEDLRLTILSKEQLIGDQALEVIQKYGSKSALTDLAIATGAYVGYTYYHIKWDNTRKGRVGNQWTTTPDSRGNVLAVDELGYSHSFLRYGSQGSIRPVIENSSLFEQLYPYKKELYEGIYYCEYGQYPQMAAFLDLQLELEKLYEQGLLKSTGRSYTLNGVTSIRSKQRFSENTLKEYEYAGERYIRVKANFYETLFQKFSIEARYKTGEYVWIKVDPVRWLLDEKTKLLISEKSLVSGIEYQSSLAQPYTGDFEHTTLNNYMNQYMVNDLFQWSGYHNEKEEGFVKTMKYGK